MIVDRDILLLGTTSKKIKSKIQDIGPFSIGPSPPTIKRDILNREIFNFISPPPSLIEIGTFLEKKFFPSTFLVNTDKNTEERVILEYQFSVDQVGFQLQNETQISIIDFNNVM